jgi:hypothetical protein
MSITNTGFSNTSLSSPNMNCNQITIVDLPIDPTDGANKYYVDLNTGGFNYKNTTYVSTTANLTAIYNNGALGVGATLTNNGALAAFQSDGLSPAINARILVRLQTSQLENGIYDLTTVGDGVTPWVLTRSSDYETAIQVDPGDLVPVANGTLYADTLWIQTDDVTVMGTDPINFNQFASAPIVTQEYNVLVGGPANTVQSVPPSATSGVPLISQGNATNPVFGEVVVQGGGTGVASFANANSLILSGATSTAPLTSLLTGAVGYVLTSVGPGLTPMWTNNSGNSLSVNVIAQASNFTYTPSAGMQACLIEVVGGGGGGGGANGGGAPSQVNFGGGGGGGGYGKAFYSAAEIGASQAVTVGAGGSGGSPGNSGNNGGTTSVGGLINVSGGSGGGSGGASGAGSVNRASGGSGGSGSGGDINAQGSQGGYGYGFSVPGAGPIIASGGYGGASAGLGGGSVQGTFNWGSGGSGGQQGLAYGGGGAGASAAGTSGGQTGGSGFGGVCVITEFIGGFTTTFSWMDNSGAFTANANIGYFLTAASTVTLPSSPSEGTTISFICDTASACTIIASAGKKIKLGNATSAIAGNIVNTLQGDSVTLVYRSSDLVWFGIGPVGNWTIN